MPSYPKTMALTFKEFESEKRLDMRELIEAAGRFRRGCACVPGYKDYAHIFDDIDRWSEELNAAWRHGKRVKNG